MGLVSSCKKEDINPDLPSPGSGSIAELGLCLSDMEVSENEIFSCDSPPSFEHCELIYLGKRELSAFAKEHFKDFCSKINSEVEFVDKNGLKLRCSVFHKDYNEGAHTLISNSNDSTNCKRFCLDSEDASISLISDRFTLDVYLQLGVSVTTVMSQDSKDIAETRFSIFARNQNLGQQIFSVPLLDTNDELISAPDTIAIGVRYHTDVLLNNKRYSDIYSNENRGEINGLTFKEKIYFHRENGLIAVRDSLGVLWTREP